MNRYHAHCLSVAGLLLLAACSSTTPQLVSNACPDLVPPVLTRDCVRRSTPADLKMMSAERLHRVLKNSFLEYLDGTESPLAYPNARTSWQQHRYETSVAQLMLGGVDYSMVRKPGDKPGLSTHLIMLEVAEQYCADLASSPNFASLTNWSDLYPEMYKAIWSRPLPKPSLTETQLASLDPGIPVDSTHREHLCQFLMLMEGSIVLY